MRKSVLARKRGHHADPQDRARHTLCAYCATAPVCTFVKRAGRPVEECEEFEALRRPETPEPDSELTSGRSGGVRSSAGSIEPVWEQMGLCGNCENRETCAFPDEEGGVWHCEEYR